MRKAIVLLASLMCLCATAFHAANAEEKKSAGVSGERFKSDMKEFGRDVKDAAVSTGHTIAEGSKKVGRAFKRKAQHPTEGSKPASGQEKPARGN